MYKTEISGRRVRPGQLAYACVAATLSLSLAACNGAPTAQTPTDLTGTPSAVGTELSDAAPQEDLQTLALRIGDNNLSSVTWSQATNGWGPVELNMSNGEAGRKDGHLATLNGKTYTKALGVQSASQITYVLGGKCQYLSADVGVDDEVGLNGSVNFQVFADDTLVYSSGKMTGATATKSFKVDISGRNTLKLVVSDGGDNTEYDHADWAAPMLLGCKAVALPVSAGPAPVPAPTPAPAPSKPIYAAPLIITQGGTYSGAWESNDPNTPAVQIKTSEPVILQNCFVRGRGDLITANWSSANLVVRGCHGYGLNPNDATRFPGRFFQAEGFVSLVLEDNYLEKTSGIYINSWIGQANAANTIVVRRNQARDIDGRYSDGRGGYQDSFYRVQFVQLNNIKNAPRVEIAWNRVVNTPRQSHVEDVISLASSSGTAASPIRVHDNLIYGAYASDPRSSYSGGGIMLGDGGGQFQEASNNTVLETSNYGIAVAGGNDLKVLNNTVLGTGKLADGTLLDADPDAGIYLRDYNNDPAHRAASVVAEGNTVGWGHPLASDPNNRWDISASPTDGQSSNNTQIQRTDWAVDPALLTKAVTSWEQRAAAAGVVAVMAAKSDMQ